MKTKVEVECSTERRTHFRAIYQVAVVIPVILFIDSVPFQFVDWVIQQKPHVQSGLWMARTIFELTYCVQYIEEFSSLYVSTLLVMFWSYTEQDKPKHTILVKLSTVTPSWQLNEGSKERPYKKTFILEAKLRKFQILPSVNKPSICLSIFLFRDTWRGI